MQWAVGPSRLRRAWHASREIGRLYAGWFDTASPPWLKNANTQLANRGSRVLAEPPAATHELNQGA